MLGWLKGRSERRRNGQQLYEGIVAQARQPSLYEACRVPDTMDGRLEMLLLHTVLSLDRLRAEGVDGQRFGQRLMERLIADVDDALRQIGIGDDGVSMRIKQLAGALSERARDYGLGLQQTADSAPGDRSLPEKSARSGAQPSLSDALVSHVYRATNDAEAAAAMPQARRLADYVVRSQATLAKLDRSELFAGRLTFPPVIGPTPRTPETSP
jgi:cytochrome b pre-mRNA-processing protein 3